MSDLPRRGLLAGGLATLALPAHARGKVGELLKPAIRLAGGEDALERARVLAWTGEAVIHAGGRKIEIEVDTVVRPFDYARSDSWPKGRGADMRRGMILEGGAGFLERDGLRSPMPEAQRRHEAQQFATYGLMRLVTLEDKGAVVERLDHGDLRGLAVTHPSAPPAWMGFDPFGRLVRLENRVSSPGGSPGEIGRAHV
jgi:hypothetical protein